MQSPSIGASMRLARVTPSNCPQNVWPAAGPNAPQSQLRRTTHEARPSYWPDGGQWSVGYGWCIPPQLLLHAAQEHTQHRSTGSGIILQIRSRSSHTPPFPRLIFPTGHSTTLLCPKPVILSRSEESRVAGGPFPTILLWKDSLRLRVTGKRSALKWYAGCCAG